MNEIGFLFAPVFLRGKNEFEDRLSSRCQDLWDDLET